MDFPILDKNKVPHGADEPSPWLEGDEREMYVGDVTKVNIPRSEYDYTSMFDQNGFPRKCNRSDGILGPTVMFVNVDLLTATYLGSVFIIYPAPSQQPTISFRDGVALQPYFGNPTILAKHNASIFCRYDFAIPLDINLEKRIEYNINNTPEVYNFTIPSQTSQWRWCFWSCNGWSLNVEKKAKDKLGGDNVVWDSLLEKHKKFPFHVMVGGGDQLYCDLLWNDDVWKPWFETKHKANRKAFTPTPEMESYLDNFFFAHYTKNFFYTSKFTDALTTVPFAFIIDDHDIFDGWGSYPEYLHSSKVFQMVKFYAFKYFLLFQAHSNYELSRTHGYFGKEGFSWLKNIGPFAAILGVDTRYERTLSNVVSNESYDMIFDRLYSLPVSTKHLFVITGVPIVYPRLTYVEGALSFLVSSKLKNLSIFQKDGALASICNQFGEPELLDDLNDHWTAEIHMEERRKLIERLQEFARTRGIRVTLVAGDVHCCGIGRFATEQGKIKPENDYRYMTQIVSSAIMNIPPPNAVIRMCHYSAKKYMLNEFTNEKMFEIFTKDVNEQDPPNNNKKLLARRNFASFAEDPAIGAFYVSIHVQKDTNDGTKSYFCTIPPLVISNGLV
ncbi:hypothetical protein BB560_000829 [Smittium megazygosporum]|uniref:PhoD-like phosphatase domain-containing protein n=1 Tax=Smittium megazygosporum TaxID=133381 RepID=A0A2T9ZJ96_9FUNG|nr:hypothetical protein BB560_000829 [Smittium megazygosporum]